MSNMSLTAINVNDSCFASVASDNFTEVLDVINGKLDSDNYGVSTVKSRHVSSNAIHSEHISDSNVVSEKIATAAIRQTHMDFVGADGVRVLQYGTNMPANGIIAARLSQTLAVASAAGTATASINIKWSDAIDGNPEFTTDPVLNNPVLMMPSGAASLWAATNGDPTGAQLVAMNSASADYKFYYEYAHEAHTATVYVLAQGAK
jgi:hypothetical protein